MEESGDHRVSADDHIFFDPPPPLSTCPFLLKRFAARRDAKTGRLVKSSKDERTSPQSKAGGRIHPLKFLRSRGKKREGKPRLLDLITPWENSD